MTHLVSGRVERAAGGTLFLDTRSVLRPTGHGAATPACWAINV